jgi:hypothetical protein
MKQGAVLKETKISRQVKKRDTVVNLAFFIVLLLALKLLTFTFASYPTLRHSIQPVNQIVD